MWKALLKNGRDWRYRLSVRSQSALLKARLPDVSMRDEEIALFSVVNNEEVRLPYFLDYYRSLGISKFFVLDHQSTDRTKAILEREGVFAIPVSGDFVYKEAWLDVVLRQYGHGRWCLVVDADELLVFPGQGAVALTDLCRYLDAEGRSALKCRLVDMFPDGSLAQAVCMPGQSPLAVAPMFDSNLTTRHRAFGVDPYLDKRPLLRFSAETVRLTAGQHFAEGTIDSEITGAILHFKFLADFLGPRTLSRATAAGMSSDRDPSYARETAAYADAVATADDLYLSTPTATRYEGPAQLVDLGIMSASEDYERWKSSLEAVSGI